MFKRNGKYFWERDDGTRDAVRRSVRESMQLDIRAHEARDEIVEAAYHNDKAGIPHPPVPPVPADIDTFAGENPADVLIDALQADPDAISGDAVNELFARLDAAIYGVTRPAPVIKLVPRDDRG